jgi:hypothetical protein
MTHHRFGSWPQHAALAPRLASGLVATHCLATIIGGAASMNWQRILTGLGVASGLAIIIIGVLAFAHSWAPERSEDAKVAWCFVDIASSQFPKWLGCAMAAHENLAGGLIAGGGALLAAWIAASIVREQINDDRRRERRARQNEIKREINALIASRNALEDAQHTFWDQWELMRSRKWPNVEALARVGALGKLNALLGPASSHPEGIAAQNLLASLHTLATELQRVLLIYDHSPLNLEQPTAKSFQEVQAAILDRAETLEVPHYYDVVRDVIFRLKEAIGTYDKELREYESASHDSSGGEAGECNSGAFRPRWAASARLAR